MSEDANDAEYSLFSVIAPSEGAEHSSPNSPGTPEFVTCRRQNEEARILPPSSRASYETCKSFL